MEKMRLEKYPKDRGEMTSQCDVFAFMARQHSIAVSHPSAQTKILAQAVFAAWEIYKSE